MRNRAKISAITLYKFAKANPGKSLADAYKALVPPSKKG